MRSALFSNEWMLSQRGETLAAVKRLPRHHSSGVRLADGTRWILQPDGWGVVRAIEAGAPIAKAVRETMLPRRWELSGVGFSYVLTPEGPWPRHWAVRLGEEPVMHLRGASLTYNRVKISAQVGVPMAAVLLAWHVIARPWEAAAFAPRIVAGDGRVEPSVSPP